jgi:hypothetical protein
VSINDIGVALGHYTDKTGHTAMFLYDNGRVATLTVPNAVSVSPVSINNLNDIAGTYTDVSGAIHGFFGAPPTSISSLFSADQANTATGVAAPDPTTLAANMLMPLS